MLPSAHALLRWPLFAIACLAAWFTKPAWPTGIRLWWKNSRAPLFWKPWVSWKVHVQAPTPPKKIGVEQKSIEICMARLDRMGICLVSWLVLFLWGHHRGAGFVLCHPCRDPCLWMALCPLGHAESAALDVKSGHGQGVQGATWRASRWRNGFWKLRCSDSY